MKKNKFEDVWKRINIKGDDDCWEWGGYLKKDGYGTISINSLLYYVHRVVYILTYGSIPNEKLILHHCDNRKCCNPKHLFLGTDQDNSNDMLYKHRQNRGEKVNTNKLTTLQVLKIRKLYSTGNYLQRELGEIYEITSRNICSIVNNKTWRHI